MATDSEERDAVARLAAGRGGLGRRAVVVEPTSSGALIARAGDVVLKVHRVGTSRVDLDSRLAVAADVAYADCLLAPLDATAVELPTSDGAARLVSAWPLVDVVPQVPEAVPWAAAGELLARLHRRPPPPGRVPGHGGPARLARALRELGAARSATARPDLRTAVTTVLAAAGSLEDAASAGAAPGRPRTLVHGDWHLGQLGRPGTVRAGRGGWLLLDVDDLGVGDPAWDLARPAALLAAGLLDPRAWTVLVDSYRAAGGPALPPAPAEPWPAVDPVARAAVVQGAAAVVRRALRAGRALDEGDEALVRTCAALAV